MDDEQHLRRAIEIAEDAARRGDRPFGAMIVSADGRVVAEGCSTQQADHDWTAHAEMNVIRAAGNVLGWQELATATIYASSDPCPMCAGAIYWSNIRRLVFGADEASMRHLRADNAQGAGLTMSCREVLARSARPIEVVGPLLEDEAIRAHEVFWRTSKAVEGWV
jgi:tRNA(adenine34) deaminase